jgi:hypothetical protein
VELRVNADVFAFQGFGQTRDISRASSGRLYVDFKKASVAETVCHISLIFPFFLVSVLCFEFRFLLSLVLVPPSVVWCGESMTRSNMQSRCDLLNGK